MSSTGFVTVEIVVRALFPYFNGVRILQNDVAVIDTLAPGRQAGIDDQYHELLKVVERNAETGDEALIIEYSCSEDNHQVRESDALDKVRLVAIEALQKSIEFRSLYEELLRFHNGIDLLTDIDNSVGNFVHGQWMIQQICEASVSQLDLVSISVVFPSHGFSYRAGLADHVERSSTFFTITERRYWDVLRSSDAIIANNNDPESASDLKDCSKIIVSPLFDGYGTTVGALYCYRNSSQSDFENIHKKFVSLVARNINRIIHACYDDITGLTNRSGFEFHLEQALLSVRSENKQCSALLVDVDQLRIINEACGFYAGDIVLGQIATILKTYFARNPTLSRVGGDRFAVVLNTDVNGASRLAYMVRTAVRNAHLEWSDRQFGLSVCIGVVPIMPQAKGAADVVTMLELAVDAAKEKGKSTVHVYTTDDISVAQDKNDMEWVTRIVDAIKDNRLVLYAQEIKDIKHDMRFIHYEILIRMRDENGNILAPGQFLPAAEKYLLMPEIDLWVAKNALKQIMAAGLGESSIVWGVNLSGQTMGNKEYLDAIEKAVINSGIDPHAICFEITETAAIGNLAEAGHFISRLKHIGCRFALDDFGTGVSSFSYLKQLPLDFLKIDGCFVKDIVGDPVLGKMVSSISDLGHLMGLQVIGEYVENREIEQILHVLGVDYAQGYGIAKPVPLDEVLRQYHLNMLVGRVATG